VADADYGEVSDFAFGNEALNILVIPGIAIEQINGDQAVAGFNLMHQVPFDGHIGADRFFRQHVLVVGKGMANLLWSRIGQGKQAYGINGWVVKDGIGTLVDCGVG
jgi:hypothetical protein